MLRSMYVLKKNIQKHVDTLNYKQLYISDEVWEKH